MKECNASPGWEKGWRYGTVQTRIEKLETVTYGLVLYAQDGAELERIEDVTTDECFAKKLARLFTSQQLEPIHFPEVVEDVLACPEVLMQFESPKAG